MEREIPVGGVENNVESDKLQEPIQEAPAPTSTESNSQQRDESPPLGDQANLYLYSFLQQYNANQNQNEIREQQRDAIDRKRLRVEKAAVWVGVLGIVGLLFNLYEIREANKIARQTLAAAGRPWVGADAFGQVEDLNVGKSPSINIRVKNYGESPAFTTSVRYVMGLVPISMSEGDLIEGASKSVWREMGTLWPKQEGKGRGILTVSLTENYIKNIQERTLRLMIWGQIVYGDQMGGLHHSWFQIVYNPEGKGFISEHPMDAPIDD